jgi:hypothetical protein
MKKYSTWAIGLRISRRHRASPRVRSSRSSTGGRCTNAWRWPHLHRPTTASKSQAGPLDVFPGEVPSGAEFYRQSYPHALELRRQLVAAMRGGKKLQVNEETG